MALWRRASGSMVAALLSVQLGRTVFAQQASDAGNTASNAMDASVASDANRDASDGASAPDSGCAEGTGAVDRAGHCCAPGQHWQQNHCVGTPTSCPPGWMLLRSANHFECRERPAPVSDAGSDAGDAGRAAAMDASVAVDASDSGAPGTEVALAVPTGMVRVPAGRFRMGARGAESARWVSVSSFVMDRTEVTAGAYRRCVSAGRCAAITDPFGLLRDPRVPVVNVTAAMASAYCHFAGGRLPTEAEWELAARGPQERTYPWGEQPPTCARANGLGCGGRALSSGARALGRTELGIEDLAGNVAEWTLDTHGTLSASAARDPLARGAGARVVRGGSFESSEAALRSFSREARGAQEARFDLGFRCVR